MLVGERESFDVGSSMLLLTSREKVTVAGACEQREEKMKLERSEGSGNAGSPKPWNGRLDSNPRGHEKSSILSEQGTGMIICAF